MVRSGRRPGNQDTRETILVAARKAFAANGFDGTSVRSIAAAAEVDPALVHHYFGTKEKLFIQAMHVPAVPSEIVPQVLKGDPDHLGERIIRAVLTLWDSPAGTAAAALLRSAVQQEWTARLLREFLTTQVLRQAARGLGITNRAEASMRASLVFTQISGLIMARYIVRIEPVASLPAETVVSMIGPTIQNYLTMPLPQ